MSQSSSTPKIARGARHLLWWMVGGLMLVASLFTGPQVWAQDVLCAGNSSIPITPLVIYAVQGISQTYDVSLCTDPTAPVTVTPVLSPTGHIDVAPAVLTFLTSVTQTVAVSLSNDVSLTEVFTVAIRHNTASDDPNYNWGTTNTPTVLVIYDGPLAVNDAAATRQGTPVTINVLQNDRDRSGTGIQVVSVTQPVQGVAAATGDNTITFTPTVAFTGTATFAYTMRDGRGNRDDAEVFVQVTPSDSNSGVPEIVEVDPAVDNTATFTLTEDALAVVTVELPAGFFDGALGPRDVLYIALTPIITPSNTVPPDGTYFIGLYYFLGIYLNDQLYDIDQLAAPITVTIDYATLPTRARTTTVSPPPYLYYLEGGAWTQQGLELLENNVEQRRIIIRTQVINREFALVNATVLHLPIIARSTGQSVLHLPLIARTAELRAQPQSRMRFE